MYAIHSSDVTAMAQADRIKIIFPFVIQSLLTGDHVEVDRQRFDGFAAIVRPEIGLGRLVALRDVLCAGGWLPAYFRVYERGPQGGWHKVRLPKYQR